jgi:hypothetical protein
MRILLPLALVFATAFLPAQTFQSMEDKARAQFESEGAANMSKADMIILLHDYKRDLAWELQRNLNDKVRVAQLEVVVQNMTNELLAIYWHRDMLKVMREDEMKLSARILQLKGEVNELQRKRDDLRRAL